MNPDDIPQELVHAAAQAWKAAPQKRDGEPTRMRYALAEVWPEIEAQVRAKVAAEARDAAAEFRGKPLFQQEAGALKWFASRLDAEIARSAS